LKDLNLTPENSSQYVKGMLKENLLSGFTVIGLARLHVMVIMRFIYIPGKIEGSLSGKL